MDGGELTVCDDHSETLVYIPTASARGPHGRHRAIDACIAPLVDALNKGGMPTLASCCGHNQRPGTIALADGRELFVASGWAMARQMEDGWPYAEVDRLAQYARVGGVAEYDRRAAVMPDG